MRRPAGRPVAGGMRLQQDDQQDDDQDHQHGGANADVHDSSNGGVAPYCPPAPRRKRPAFARPRDRVLVRPPAPLDRRPPVSATPASSAPKSPWLALGVIATAMLMTILDGSVATTKNMVIRIGDAAARDATIRGKVVDASGAPLDDVLVTADGYRSLQQFPRGYRVL